MSKDKGEPKTIRFRLTIARMETCGDLRLPIKVQETDFLIIADYFKTLTMAERRQQLKKLFDNAFNMMEDEILKD